jgi:bifunctional non-homologous end joining protein LigD
MPKKPSKPTFIEPMAALKVAQLPDGDAWLYEVKWDGYRMLVIKDGKAVRLLSRNNKEHTASYPSIVAAAVGIKAKQAVIDGELVALDETGRPSFQALQNRSSHIEERIKFYAFDLIHLDGQTLTQEPIERRRSLLEGVVQGSGLAVSDLLPGKPEAIIKAIREIGLEGVIAKRKGSANEPGERSGDWVKLRLDLAQEFVVGGFTPGGVGFDALLVGYNAGKRLKFAGKVRAGFVPHTRRELAALLGPYHTAECPFPDLPDIKKSRWGAGVTEADMASIQWVKPSVVVQIKFLEWTTDARLRHAAYVGLRHDKAAKDVTREVP